MRPFGFRSIGPPRPYALHVPSLVASRQTSGDRDINSDPPARSLAPSRNRRLSWRSGSGHVNKNLERHQTVTRQKIGE
jgi:hypothetical protein